MKFTRGALIFLAVVLTGNIFSITFVIYWAVQEFK